MKKRYWYIAATIIFLTSVLLAVVCRNNMNKKITLKPAAMRPISQRTTTNTGGTQLDMDGATMVVDSGKGEITVTVDKVVFEPSRTEVYLTAQSTDSKDVSFSMDPENVPMVRVGSQLVALSAADMEKQKDSYIIPAKITANYTFTMDAIPLQEDSTFSFGIGKEKFSISLF